MEVLWRRSDLVGLLAWAAAINCAGCFSSKFPGLYFTTAVFVNSFVAAHCLILCPCFSRICHFRNEKATGAEMCLAIVCWIVAGHAPVTYYPGHLLVSYWPGFLLSRVIVPEVFAKV